MLQLQGKTYNRLTVIDRAPKRKSSSYVYWTCQCSCGNFVTVRSSCIQNGRTKSCGCLIIDQAKAHRASGIPQQKTAKRQHRYNQSDKGRHSARQRQVRYNKTLKARVRKARFSRTVKGLVGKRYHQAFRRLATKLQTPIWADLKKIKDIYLNCPHGMTVDHIVPLQGKLVSGLHVETNMQYLTVAENAKKNNKFE